MQEIDRQDIEPERDIERAEVDSLPDPGQVSAVAGLNEDELEQQVGLAQDPELLKDLMAAAIQFGREDLVEVILERSIRMNRLLDKLQDFELKPNNNLVFLSDDDEPTEQLAGPAMLAFPDSESAPESV